MANLTNPALRSIEEAYSIALNPELDYFAQLQPLAPAGELASRLTSNQVLFKLCMIVDKQAKEIQALKEQRLEARDEPITNEARHDPEKPL